MIHTVKGFDIVNKAEVDIFSGTLSFLMIQWMLSIWSLVLLPFLKPAWTSGSSWVHVLLKPGLENFEHCFASLWDECNCAVVWSFFWQCLSLGLEWKPTISSPVATAEFSKFVGKLSECSTFTASSFRIWNCSTGIPSPPLALFIVMLPKAHLTSHSRMSGSRWVITPSWLSGSWKYFLYKSSVYCIAATSS